MQIIKPISLLLAAFISSQTLAATPLVKLTYDEANGSTTVADAMGGSAYSIQTVANQNPAERVPGINGNALRTDGYSTWVTGPFAPTGGSAVTSQFAISTWIALESYPSTDENNLTNSALFHQMSGSNGFRIGINTYGEWWFDVNIGGTLQKLKAPTLFPLYNWTHVAATVNNGLVKLYINGAEVASQQFTSGNLVLATSASVVLGRADQPHQWNEFEINAINAAYDDTRLYNTVPTQSELNSEYLAGRDTPWRDSIDVPDTRFASDNLRPRYHAMPKANWTNEPHGLVRYNNQYHIFYQRTPNGPYKQMMHWGHMVSGDLVYWDDLKDSHYPMKSSGEIYGLGSKGIWSGNVVVDNNKAHAFYTTVNHDNPGINEFDPGVAWSTSTESNSNFEHWQHKGGVIDKNTPNPGGINDFRDPYVWKQDNVWHMLIGADLAGDNNAGLEHYTTTNIDSGNWVRASAPFSSVAFSSMNSMGANIWEMPVFEYIGTHNGQAKYVLVASPIGGNMQKNSAPYVRSVYWTGTWNASAANGAGQFTPDYSTPKFLDVIHGHVSPTITRDGNNNLVAVGIVDERTNATFQNSLGWAHTFGLPRAWTLLSDGQTLGQVPVAAMTNLRNGSPASIANQNVSGETTLSASGNQVEIVAEVNTAQVGSSYGFIISASPGPNRDESTRIYYDGDNVVIDKSNSTNFPNAPYNQFMEEMGSYSGEYDETAFGVPQRWRIFIDHSVVSVFINDKAVFENRIYPSRSDSTQIALFSTGGTTQFTSVDVYQLKSSDTTSDTKLQLKTSTPVVEHAENGATIDVHLFNNTFASSLASSAWTVTGLPAGVSLGSVSRISNTLARLTLSGNSTADYDTDITNIQLQVQPSQVQSAVNVSSLKATGARLTAVQETVTNISLQAEGTLDEGTESTKSILVTLSNNRFVSPLNSAHWAVTNLPAGLGYSLQYVNATTVRLLLSGVALDYDSNISNLSVSIAGAALVNSDAQLNGGPVSKSSGVSFIAKAGQLRYNFDAGNLSDWIVTSGNAFTDLHVANTPYWDNVFLGPNGNYHYFGFNLNAPGSSGDQYTGQMRTGPFVLEGDGQIRYLISGGKHPNDMYVALINACTNQELYRGTGYETEIYRARLLDAKDYIGQILYFKVVDNVSGGWGHINLDDLRIPVVDSMDGQKLTSTSTAVTGVSLSSSVSQLEVGQSTTLTATVSPVYACNKTVIWSSSNTAVATVSNGQVTAVSAGRATITATTQDGSFVATSSVQVYPAAVTRVYDFEAGTLDGWTVTGTAFSTADISTATTYWGTNPFNHQGSKHLWGFQSGGDTDTGSLTSAPFILSGDGIVRLLLAGGTDSTNLYVAVTRVSDGAELGRITGNNSEGYAERTLDVSAYKGQVLQVKIVDNSTGSFGHLNVDNVRIPERLAPIGGQLVYDFEAGNLNGWTVSGAAFAVGDISTATGYWGGFPFKHQGAKHLWSFQSGGGDTDTGSLTSQTFVLGGDGVIRFKLSGGKNLSNLYLAVVRNSDNAELFKATGNNSEGYDEMAIDASAYLGETLKIKLVDNATGSFGHINLDDLRIPTGVAANPSVYDFESGNLSGWTVIGSAFSTGDVASESCYWVECYSFNRHGNYHLWGFKSGGDNQTGELRTTNFTLAGNSQISMLLGGGNNIDLLYVGVVDTLTGTLLTKITGSDSEALSARTLDASLWAGRQVYLRVMDSSTGGFGHVNLDYVQIPVAP
jgi:sucrose-6-phosphate hydrolase SacC (GH32 family)/uncharacterized protein YjdB